MLHIVALLYAGDGGVPALRAFERQAIAILRSHGGNLISALAPAPAPDGTEPDEIHLLTFPSLTAFEAYRNDPRLAALSDERAHAIRQTVVYTAAETVSYDD